MRKLTLYPFDKNVPQSYPKIGPHAAVYTTALIATREGSYDIEYQIGF